MSENKGAVSLQEDISMTDPKLLSDSKMENVATLRHAVADAREGVALAIKERDDVRAEMEMMRAHDKRQEDLLAERDREIEALKAHKTLLCRHFREGEAENESLHGLNAEMREALIKIREQAFNPVRDPNWAGNCLNIATTALALTPDQAGAKVRGLVERIGEIQLNLAQSEATYRGQGCSSEADFCRSVRHGLREALDDFRAGKGEIHGQ